MAFCIYKLTLNTKIYDFWRRTLLKYVEDVPLYVNGDIIERVWDLKYLGVYLDECLTFEKHTKYIYNKASSTLGAIRKVRECMNQPTALQLYKSLVLPYFDYCDTVYMTANKDILNKLQLLQNSACKTMLLVDHDFYVYQMHNELGLSYLSERSSLHFYLQVQKTIYSDSQVNF